MLQKITVQSIATALIVMLIIITVAYYIFPEQKNLLIFLSSIIGAGPFVIIAVLIAIGTIISITKIVIRHIKNRNSNLK
jgi:hypothetical protein